MLEDHKAITSKVFDINVVKKGYYWIVLVAGFLFLAFGKLNFFSFYKDWKEFFSTSGTILITSGVFASLLKTIQYLGIIKDTLTDIVFDVKYLKNRKDIESYWHKVNSVLFGEKFSDISEKIESDIKEVYFPNDNERYYKNYHFDIDIKLNDINPEFIEISQIVKFFVVTGDSKMRTFLKYSNKILRTWNDPNDLTKFKLIYWKVNGKSQKNIETEKSTQTRPHYKIELQGNNEYEIERKTLSIYSFKLDPFKSFIENNFIIDKMTVEITLHNNLTCEFWEVGTLNKFESQGTSASNKIKKHYDGLIYKRQGFKMYIK